MANEFFKIGEEVVFQTEEPRLLTREECTEGVLTYIGWDEFSLGDTSCIFRCVVYGGTIIECDGSTFNLKNGFWANQYNKKGRGRRVWIGKEKPTEQQRKERKWDE